MSKKQFFILGYITLFGFSALGITINYFFSNSNIYDLYFEGSNIIFQILIGLFIGFVGAATGWQIIIKILDKPSFNKYVGMVKSLNLKPTDILFISFCAGFGEELLFRASLQNFFGVIITSILFVAIHGYLHPKNWRLSVYGSYMTFLIAIIGLMYQQIGLVSAIAAHFIIDVVLLFKLNEHKLEEQNENLIST